MADLMYYDPIRSYQNSDSPVIDIPALAPVASSVKEALTPTNAVDPVISLNTVPNQVSIKNHTYPEDLMDDNQYGGNFIVFYIKILEDATLDTPGKPKTIPGVGRTDRDRGRLDGINIGPEGETALNYALSTTAGAVAGGAASKFFTTTTNSALNYVQPQSRLSDGFTKFTNTFATLTGAAAGIFYNEKIVSSFGGLKQQYKLTDTAIALYVPNELSVRYSASWRTNSMALADAILRSGAEFFSDNVDLNSSIGSTGSAIDPILGYGAAAALNAGEVGAAVSKLSKTAPNPKKEQLFETIDFRTFQFNYRFYPRSEDEAKLVHNIIKAFKYHMHPEYRKGSNEFLFAYPSEFDIVYYNNGVENPHLHKHASCVLTDMSVNYTPEGTFAAHKGGNPNAISMNLIFKETAILTKKDIYEGF